LAVPPRPTPYKTVLVALLDFQQENVVLNGKDGTRHQLELTAGTESVLTVQTRPLTAGVHKLVLVFFDDDREPGLFGWHDLLADIYVGADPKLTPLSDARELPSRRDSAVASANYGVFLTVSRDRMQLVSNLRWQPNLSVYASVYGSQREPDRPVALAVFQNYQQIERNVPRFLVVHAGAVTPVIVTLSAPTLASESLRALIITNPDREIAPDGSYDRAHIYMAFASQKAYIELH
jgi:hypothetical protein